jgi:hypothetical protein
MIVVTPTSISEVVCLWFSMSNDRLKIDRLCRIIAAKVRILIRHCRLIAPKSKSRIENVDLSINFSMIDAQLWSGQVILIVYQSTNHQGAGLPSHSPPAEVGRTPRL